MKTKFFLIAALLIVALAMGEDIVKLAHAQIHTQEFPEDPGGYNGHIADTGTHPVDTGTHPVDTGTHPVDTGTHPVDTGTHSLQVTGFSLEAVPSYVDWTARADGPPPSAGDSVVDIVASPDGSKVYVTGLSTVDSNDDYLTVAYDSADGSVLWARRYDGPTSSTDTARSIAVSPDGSKVFVTGRSEDSTEDYLTIAYNTVDGSVAWTKRYDGPGAFPFVDDASAIAVSPDGTKIYVTGESVSGTFNYLTIAYNSADGSVAWIKRYASGSDDFATAVVVAPDSLTVYVTGGSSGPTTFDYATIAYSAVDGSVVWAKRYDGGSFFDFPSETGSAFAVSPDGLRVYVTGVSFRVESGIDYLTIAYNSGDGSVAWTKRYDGPLVGFPDEAQSIAASPDGSKVYVTGISISSISSGVNHDYLTIAYNSTDGGVIWTKRYDGQDLVTDIAQSVAVSPDNSKVYVTGVLGITTIPRYATIAYNSGDGSVVWARTYSAFALDDARSVVVSPDGSKAYVTGMSFFGIGSSDYLTIAYQAAASPVVCGNGVVEGSEQCDDGNFVDGDGCSSTCTIEVCGTCGNGILESPEQCDDGNLIDGDGCSSLCFPDPECGNGLLETFEECDDGNFVDDDDCSNGCTLQYDTCGDGFLQPFELCDDGNTVGGDGCTPFCDLETVCGDGVIERFEQCDDGNLIDGDSCSSSCGIISDVCGNGIVESPEQCDDGNFDEGDGCSSFCTIEVCGDGIITPNEQCDDSNALNGDGCSSVCTYEVGCGNGIIESLEQCDDGNNIDGDGCSSFCTSELCGDGILTPNEGCDDGNTVGGDGCSSTCAFEFCVLEACIPPPSQMFGWWPGDGTGDELVANNDVTLQNGATFAPGNVDQAFSFDGADDFANTADDVMSTPSALTMDAWVKHTPQAGKSRVVSVEGAYIISIGSDGKVQCIVDGGEGNFALSDSPVDDGAFHFLTCTSDGTTTSIFVDGVLEGTAFESFFDINTLTRPISIGLNNPFLSGGDGPYAGLIDEVEIYTKELTQAEIEAIFNAGSAGKCKEVQCVPSEEVCDGVDNDCDELIDEGIAPVVTDPTGFDDIGECKSQVEECIGGTFVITQGAVGPVAEQCDGLDNDCDGIVDNGIDDDGDSFNDCNEDKCLGIPGPFEGCPNAIQEEDTLKVHYHKTTKPGLSFEGFACVKNGKEKKECKLPLQLGPIGDSRNQEVTFAHKKIFRLADLTNKGFGTIKKQCEEIYDGTFPLGGAPVINERDEVTNQELLGVPGPDDYVLIKRVHIFDPGLNQTHSTTICKSVTAKDFKPLIAKRKLKLTKDVFPTHIELKEGEDEIVSAERTIWEQAVASLFGANTNRNAIMVGLVVLAAMLTAYLAIMHRHKKARK